MKNPSMKEKFIYNSIKNGNKARKMMEEKYY